jgi:hypothetical protein
LNNIVNFVPWFLKKPSVPFLTKLKRKKIILFIFQKWRA